MTVPLRPLADGGEEICIAEFEAQGMQTQSAALVHAVVEHVRPSRITEQDVLRLRGQLVPPLPRTFIGTRTPGLLRPQPLCIAGEALVEPDVLPPRRRERVSEPLVRHLVGDEAFGLPLGPQMIGPEHGQRLRLERDLEHIIGHDHVVDVERVRAEAFDEQVHHSVLDAEALDGHVPMIVGIDAEGNGGLGPAVRGALAR